MFIIYLLIQKPWVLLVLLLIFIAKKSIINLVVFTLEFKLIVNLNKHKTTRKVDLIMDKRIENFFNSIKGKKVAFCGIGTSNLPLIELFIKYGAVGITYFAEQFTPEYNPATGAQYSNQTKGVNHGVTLIGWDDNYSASNFLITPPGDGAWIFKNSWGENSGNDGYYYASYYDVNFATHIESVAFVLENAVEYNMNYQMDIGGQLTFKQANEYENAFVAVADDLIAGVGTYFNATGADYIVEVYVNDVLKLNQSGTSPF